MQVILHEISGISVTIEQCHKHRHIAFSRVLTHVQYYALDRMADYCDVSVSVHCDAWFLCQVIGTLGFCVRSLGRLFMLPVLVSIMEKGSHYFIIYWAGRVLLKTRRQYSMTENRLITNNGQWYDFRKPVLRTRLFSSLNSCWYHSNEKRNPCFVPYYNICYYPNTQWGHLWYSGSSLVCWPTILHQGQAWFITKISLTGCPRPSMALQV